MLREAKDKVNSEDHKYTKHFGCFSFSDEFYLHVGTLSSP